MKTATISCKEIVDAIEDLTNMNRSMERYLDVQCAFQRSNDKCDLSCVSTVEQKA
jgi:hypothetical protein